MHKKTNPHWTERSTADFVHRIAADFAIQIEKRMRGSISQKELAERMGVSEGNVSQSFNNPSNFTLKKIVRLARALGLKVSVVAYDDNDPGNQNGPIHSEIFEACWERADKPADFFRLRESTQAFAEPASFWRAWDQQGRGLNWRIDMDPRTTVTTGTASTAATQPNWTSEMRLGGS